MQVCGIGLVGTMDADYRGFSFATRASDPFEAAPPTQALDDIPVMSTERSSPKRKTERPVRSRLSTIARQQISTSGLLDLVEPSHTSADLIVSPQNFRALTEIVQEVRRAEDLRRHGLAPRSKLLFCGPPGCGKTLCAEVIAQELHLPLLVARLDGIITTYLGETASNLRKVFESALETPVVLFLDEFDALARARSDASEHNEIRRVVNSLLMMIDRFAGKGLLIAATNLESAIDEAAWRRFDEVILFERPTIHQIRSELRLKLRNYPVDFDPTVYADNLLGMSFAEIERICLNAVKRSILERTDAISAIGFEQAIDTEKRRIAVRTKVGTD